MRGKLIYIYYLILLVLMMTWTSVDSAPPMPIRLGYLALVILPGLRNNNALLIAAITLFWSVSVNGYAYSYMPTMNYLYALVAIVCLILHKKQQAIFNKNDYIFLVVFFVYFTFVNFLTSMDVYDISYAFLVLCLFPLLSGDIDKESVDLFTYVFMLITIVLSFYSLTTQTLFAGQYGTFEGIERSGWADPNYLAMIVGMGSLVGFYNMLSWGNLNWIVRILSATAFLIALPAMLLIASRGSFVCLLGGIAVLVFSTRIKTGYKFLAVLASAIFLIYLYQNSYFDLMEARLQADDGTGSNRTLIWEHKLEFFFGEGNIINYLFGFGQYDGIRAGNTNVGGFHNDYVAFLVCYGAIGFIMFMRWLTLPFFRVNRQSPLRFLVYAGVLYLALACMTLEPIDIGMFVYPAFWLFLSMISRVSYNECSDSD